MTGIRLEGFMRLRTSPRVPELQLSSGFRQPVQVITNLSVRLWK